MKQKIPPFNLSTAFLFKLLVLIVISFLSCSIQIFGQPTQTSNQDPSALKYSAIPGKKDLLKAKDNTGNTWVKGKIPTALLHQSLLFQIPTVEVSNYDLYVYENKELVHIKKNSNREDFHIKGRYPLYSFSTDNPTYYLNIGHQSIRKLKVQIDRLESFILTESSNMAWDALFYGLLIMSLIFNLILFFIFKDQRFILYFFLQFSLLCTFFYEDGIFYYVLNGTKLSPYFSFFNSALTSILAGLFSYHFLDLKYRAPRFKKITTVIAIAMVGVILLYMWTDLSFFHTLTSISFFLIPLLCFYHAIKWFKKDIYAQYLMLTFGIVVLSGALYTLGKYVTSSFLAHFDFNIFRLANILVIISITFIILFKVKHLQRQHHTDKKVLEKKLAKLEKDKNLLLEKAHEPFPKNKEKTKIILLDKLKKQHELTKRETEILHCLFDRQTNKEISENLYISLSTVKYHVSNLYFKLEVKNRREVHKILDNHNSINAPIEFLYAEN